MCSDDVENVCDGLPSCVYGKRAQNLTYPEIMARLPWRSFLENKDLSDREIIDIFQDLIDREIIDICQDLEATYLLSLCKLVLRKDQEYQDMRRIYNKLADVHEKIQTKVGDATTHEYFVSKGSVFKKEIGCVDTIRGIMSFFSPILKQPTMDIIWGKMPPIKIRRYHNRDVLHVFDRLFHLMATHEPYLATWDILCDMLGFFISMYQCNHFFWNESFYFELALSIFDKSIPSGCRATRVLETCHVLLDAIEDMSEENTSKRQLNAQCTVENTHTTKRQKVCGKEELIAL